MNGETRGGFCGHRNEYEIPVGATERTRMQIIRRYRSGVSEFWSGGMGWFDRACEQTVRKLRSSGEIGQDAQLWLFVIINMLFYGFPAAQRRKAALGGRGIWMMAERLYARIWRQNGFPAQLSFQPAAVPCPKGDYGAAALCMAESSNRFF